MSVKVSGRVMNIAVMGVSLLSLAACEKNGLFDGDLLSGLFGLLLSPGRGLVFYAPPLLLGVLGIHRAWQTERRLKPVSLPASWSRSFFGSFPSSLRETCWASPGAFKDIPASWSANCSAR